MAIRTKTEFTSLYGTSGTIFPDNTTGLISEGDVRAFGQDIADSFAIGTADTIQFIIDGGGSVIGTGVKGDIEVPFNCTITQATALADVSGSIVVDIWKDTYANFPPVDADSITAAAPVTITTATKSQNATLTGWTTTLLRGAVLRYNVDSATTVTRVTISLQVTRT